MFLGKRAPHNERPPSLHRWPHSIFLQPRSTLQTQIFLTYLKYMQRITYKETTFMPPTASTSSPPTTPPSASSTGSWVYFYYYFLFFSHSSITTPNNGSWKDFCFVHCWINNANFPQGPQGLTSIVKDKEVCWVCQHLAVPHNPLYFRGREPPSLAAREFRACFKLIYLFLINNGKCFQPGIYRQFSIWFFLFCLKHPQHWFLTWSPECEYLSNYSV